MSTVMLELADLYHNISTGLLTNNFEAVENAAVAIVDQPKPSRAQRKLISDYLDDRVDVFEDWDDQVSESAGEVAKAAKKKNRVLTMEKFIELQAGCFGCHNEFQEELKPVLHSAVETGVLKNP